MGAITGISKNGIVTINRGDSLYSSIFINMGDALNPERYILGENDRLYLSICEPKQKFENGVIRKIYTINDLNEDGDVRVKIRPSDTENLVPGTYYYEIKLKIFLDSNEEIIDTIVPRQKFVIY